MQRRDITGVKHVLIGLWLNEENIYGVMSVLQSGVKDEVENGASGQLLRNGIQRWYRPTPKAGISLLWSKLAFGLFRARYAGLISTY